MRASLDPRHQVGDDEPVSSVSAWPGVRALAVPPIAMPAVRRASPAG